MQLEFEPTASHAHARYSNVEPQCSILVERISSVLWLYCFHIKLHFSTIFIESYHQNRLHYPRLLNTKYKTHKTIFTNVQIISKSPSKRKCKHCPLAHIQVIHWGNPSSWNWWVVDGIVMCLTFFCPCTMIQSLV